MSKIKFALLVMVGAAIGIGGSAYLASQGFSPDSIMKESHVESARKFVVAKTSKPQKPQIDAKRLASINDALNRTAALAEELNSSGLPLTIEDQANYDGALDKAQKDVDAGNIDQARMDLAEARQVLAPYLDKLPDRKAEIYY